MHSRRSIILRLGLCLLLGAVTTWMVAAGFAAWGDRPSTQHQATVSPENWLQDQSPSVFRVRKWCLGAETRWAVASGAAGPGDPHVIRPMLSLVRSSAPEAPPLGAWGRWPSASDEDIISGQAQADEEGFGWPTLSFWYPLALDMSTGAYSGPGGIDLGSMTGKASQWSRAIPLLPIWRGFLLDTGFFGALWALPLFGLPLLKQARRRRKGRCPRCNYDLKRDLEHGCPECGWRRQGGA